jgi:XTP/dITP diphosphohydrolase
VKIVLATGNPHKVEEITAIIKTLGLPLEVVSHSEPLPEVIEDGATIEENAAKKAREIAAFTGSAVLADDTGLEIDALGGAPGVFAARWAGPGCSYEDNWRKALALLQEVPDEKRSARFRTVIAFCPAPGEDCLLAEGRLEGLIDREPRGEQGFGYDPVFLLPEEGQTLAELSEEEKNRHSHRFRALEALAPLLESLPSR